MNLLQSEIYNKPLHKIVSETVNESKMLRTSISTGNTVSRYTASLNLMRMVSGAAELGMSTEEYIERMFKFEVHVALITALHSLGLGSNRPYTRLDADHVFQQLDGNVYTEVYVLRELADIHMLVTVTVVPDDFIPPPQAFVRNLWQE